MVRIFKHSIKTRRNISNALTGRKLSENHIKNIRLSHQGKTYEELYGRERANYMKEATRRRMLIDNPAKRPEVREKISKKLRGRIFTKKWKKKISRALTGQIISLDTRKKMSKVAKKKEFGKWMIKMWKNPEYRLRQRKLILKGLIKKPNKIEKYLENFLNQILPNEYKYVGDGELILGGKCPDFMNINGKKKLIELYGDYWHRNDNPEDKINHYKKYGFDCLVVWEKELKNISNIKQRIIQFTSL